MLDSSFSFLYLSLPKDYDLCLADIWSMKPNTFEMKNHGNIRYAHRRNSRERYEICSKLTIKTERCKWRCSGVLIINFDHISHLVLLFLLLTLNQ